ncbi:MAG TPA: hypothetical protein PLT50_04560, partial [bacterium]|nr:hypothetical protein [bacterium]
LNKAIYCYIEGLREVVEESELDLEIGISVYREAKNALGYFNSQHVSRGGIEEESGFQKLIETLDKKGYASLFPQEMQPLFWRARAFRSSQCLQTTLDTPVGKITVGVYREACDPRWFPFCYYDNDNSVRKSAYYILAGTVSGKGSLVVNPLYDEGDNKKSFWGVEVIWTTLRKKFAWEIKIGEDSSLSFSLVREDPKLNEWGGETRQGDLYFYPVDNDYGIGEGKYYYEVKKIPPPSYVGEDPPNPSSCTFSPSPVQWLYSRWHQRYIAIFPDDVKIIEIKHPDHPTVRVNLGRVGLGIRSVGGRTHYRPPTEERD